MRLVFGLVVTLLAGWMMEAAIAANLPDPSTSSVEKISGTWLFSGDNEQDVSLYYSLSNPAPNERQEFLFFDCDTNGDDRGTLGFSVRLPAGDWLGKEIKTIKISSGNHSLKLKSYGSYLGEDTNDMWANGFVVRRTAWPVFYDFFNASDALVVEVAGRKMQFDLHGSQEGVKKLQQACPILPPCCLQEISPKETDESADADDDTAQKNPPGRWSVEMDYGGGASMNYRYSDAEKSLHYSSYNPMIECWKNGDIALSLESRDDGWEQDQLVTIKFSSGKKRYSLQARMGFTGSDGMGDDTWGVFPVIVKNKSAFYDLFNSTGVLAIDTGGTDKMLFDLRGAADAIKKIKEACPVGASKKH